MMSQIDSKPRSNPRSNRWRDPRWLQIAFLGSFLLCGMVLYGIVPWWEPPLTIGAACVTQWVCMRRVKANEAGFRSAIITGLGLSLLLRTDWWFIAPIAASIAIASKFVIRWNGKHVFNPANFGLVSLMLITPHAWSSPSQWGERGLLLAWFVLLGLAVVHRAFRTDVSLAFLLCWIALKTARVLYLGQLPAVLFHQLQISSLIVFAFFMISDPRTTPNHRIGRVVFAALVAGLGFYLQTFRWIQNGLLYSLFLLSPVVPLLDRLLRAARYHWNQPGERIPSMSMQVPKVATVAVLLAAFAPDARAFCGFYVGKAGAELFNDASQVVLARDGDRTIVTMSNDFKGNMTEFALVVPVPSVITKDQVHIGERKYIERVDAYSSPRLVEYYDPNPCEQRRVRMMSPKMSREDAAAPAGAAMADRAKSLGVTIEASYTVGEYDIIILSAKQSDGLTTFLVESGYNIPPRSAAALRPYIMQQMKFFVAKVNLKKQSQTGFSYLRPIQIAYESPKFMLPIRLGMANSQGPQDLVIFALSKSGRVESTNYATKPMPTGMDVPVFVKGDFADFYKAVFKHAWEKNDKKTLHTEYVWDTGWCDPCAANPLTKDELEGLGVFWLDDNNENRGRFSPWRGGGSGAPVLTRLHVRYDADHFPEDLVFQETGDRANFQARYVLRIPYKGDLSCDAGQQYLKQLDARHVQEAKALEELTGWSQDHIYRKMGADAPGKTGGDRPWYKRIWK